MRFSEVRSIEAAIKMIGLLSDVSKSCYSDFKAKEVFELNSVPWWIFSGVDNIFGYLEHSTDDLADWKTEFVDNFIDWLMVKKPESYGAFPVEYDMTLAMETFLGDFRDCYSARQPKFHIKDQTPLNAKEVDSSIESDYLFVINSEFLQKKLAKDNTCIVQK